MGSRSRFLCFFSFGLLNPLRTLPNRRDGKSLYRCPRGHWKHDNRIQGKFEAFDPLNMQRLRSEGKTPAEIKSATKELKAVLSLGGTPKQMARKTLKNKAITKSATS